MNTNALIRISIQNYWNFKPNHRIILNLYKNTDSKFNHTSMKSWNFHVCINLSWLYLCLYNREQWTRCNCPIIDLKMIPDPFSIIKLWKPGRFSCYKISKHCNMIKYFSSIYNKNELYTYIIFFYKSRYHSLSNNRYILINWWIQIFIQKQDSGLQNSSTQKFGNSIISKACYDLWDIGYDSLCNSWDMHSKNEQ